MEPSEAIKRERGRPKGSAYSGIKGIRMRATDFERLRALSAEMELPETMVIRQALREMAQRRGME